MTAGAIGRSDDIWRLLVRYPNCEPVLRDIPAPPSLEELHQALGVEGGQHLLTAHKRYPEQQYVVEHLDQLHDGASVSVHVPRRRIYITTPLDTEKKAVMWYPGATVEQIERAITKAAGFPAGTAIELHDGDLDAAVVLSTTIPNETHLEVTAYAFERRASRRGGAPRSASQPLAAAAGRGGASASGESRGRTRMIPSSSNQSIANSMTAGGCRASARREQSPQRGVSPTRCRSPGGSATIPAAHQSAPEEHCVHILAGHTGFIFCLCGVGDILFTGSQDSNIMIWDLNNLQYIGTLPGHRGFVKCLCASYARKTLISGSQDRTIRVWSLDSFSTTKVLYGHTGGVNAVLILEGIDVIVSGSEDRSIKVWDLGTYNQIHSLEQAHLGGIFALERFGSPIQVVSGARDRSLKVWDTTNWQTSKTLHPPHYDGVTSIAVAGKHGKFYSGSRDRSIKEWDVNSLTNSLHSLHVHGDWVQALCMSASDDILFSGSRDSTVKVWDGELQCQDVFQGHRGPVSALTMVGNRLFSASHDRTVRIWRIDQ
jgi:WD40 repeat protein